jgi:Peptidase inhibitor family I36
VADARMLALLASGIALAGSSTVMAQRWGHEPPPRDGACFYQDADYRGEYFCVGTGDSLNSMPVGMNDRISSIRTFGGARVTVFKDVRFGGSSTRFNGDVRNLQREGWNDRISSLRVWSGSDRDRESRSGNRGHSAREQGDADRIVRRAYQDILGRDPDTAGLRLYRSRVIDDGWSEEQVREALRSSPEFRQKNTMTRAKAEEIVRRAYLSVFKRAPDAGSRGYVDRVLRDHWTQQDVERELRNSPEYHRKKG